MSRIEGYFVHSFIEEADDLRMKNPEELYPEKTDQELRREKNMEQLKDGFVHDTAIVDPRSSIGKGTWVWVNAQIREGLKVGEDCVICKDVYLDHGVEIGDRCKIQNGVSIYHGVTLEDDVFVGPNAVFTNDLYPRAFSEEWEYVATIVKRGASIGANATIVCGVTLGEYCMVGAGSVVIEDVPPYTLVVGNPARVVGKIDKQGRRVPE